MLFADKMLMDATPNVTPEGYLVAFPRVGRIGIQVYGGAEVGRPNMDEVRIYRPEDEVFHADTMRSMAYLPVTNDHPPVMVDAKNWREFSRGTTGGDVARDGEYLRVPMATMDKATVEDVASGKRELSLGYTADLDWTPGTTSTGESYDAVQRNIRGNHLAIVDAARGGPMLRVIDNKPATEETTMKKIMLDGITVEVSETAAEVIDKQMKLKDMEAEKRDKRIEELEDELETLKKDKANQDAENATLKKQVEDSALTPEKLDAAVKARDSVISSAKKVLPTVVVDGKTDSDIRRQVVDAKLGDAAKGWNDEQVSASFNTLAASAPTSTTDRYAAAHRDAATSTAAPSTGRAAYLDRLAKAHLSVAK